MVEFEQLQPAAVDHRGDVAEQREALALLVDRFAADVGEALAEAEAVLEELQRGGGELLVAIEPPAGVTIGP